MGLRCVIMIPNPQTQWRPDEHGGPIRRDVHGWSPTLAHVAISRLRQRSPREICKSVAKATKVRILDPPHARRTAPDLRTRGQGPFPSHPAETHWIPLRPAGHGKWAAKFQPAWRPLGKLARCDQGTTPRSLIRIPSATRSRRRLSSRPCRADRAGEPAASAEATPAGRPGEPTGAQTMKKAPVTAALAVVAGLASTSGCAPRPRRARTQNQAPPAGALGWAGTILQAVRATPPLRPPRPAREPHGPPPQAAVPAVALVASLRRGRAPRLAAPA
jgi:hypothetical protein